MCRAKYNLNALSHDCAIGLVKKALNRGVNIAEVSPSFPSGFLILFSILESQLNL